MASSLRPSVVRAAVNLPRRIPHASSRHQIHLHHPHQQQRISSLQQPRSHYASQTRLYSSSSSSSSAAAESQPLDESMTEPEAAIASVLADSDSLRPTTSLLVRDVSGGCGSMYAIDIASPKFRGIGLLAQQRLVTRALGERVKEWHGVQIRTSVPPEDA